MRKQFLLIACLLFIAGVVWAERIDVSTARKVAENVAARISGASGLRSADGLTLAYKALPKDVTLRSTSQDIDYFVFNIGKDNGFVIVAGEDRVRPVFGYSDNGRFDPANIPTNAFAWLEGYQDEIAWAIRKNLQPTVALQEEWNEYMNGRTLKDGKEVLIETALWNQREPYNLMTPTIGGEHALTGCVATATSIVMRKHEYPDKALGGVSTFNPADAYQGQNESAPTFDKDVYNLEYEPIRWQNMPLVYGDSYDLAEGKAVASLMWQVGANVEMKYNIEESGAVTKLAAKALRDLFGYNSTRYIYKEDYRWEEWKDLIRKDLDEGLPVILDGRSMQGGHAFVCDGYTPEGTFHINWGWGGQSNGYFILSTLDVYGDGDGYKSDQGAVINIRPDADVAKVVEAPIVTSMSGELSQPLKNLSTVSVRMKYTGFENTVYYCGLGVVDAAGSIFQKPADPMKMDLEAFSSGCVYTDWTFSITLQNSLSEGQRIVMLYSMDGKENWEVMRSSVEVPLGFDDNGFIYQTDEPNDPEEPINVSLSYNHFDNCYMYNQGSKQGSITLTVTQTDNIQLCYTLKDGEIWSSGTTIYYSFDTYINSDNKDHATIATIGKDGKFWIKVPADKIKEGKLQYYLRIETKGVTASALEYSLGVYDGDDLSVCYETFEGCKLLMVGKGLQWSADKTMLTGGKNTEIPFTLTPSDIDNAYLNKPATIKLDLIGINPEQATLYYVSEGTKKLVSLEAMTLDTEDGEKISCSSSAVIPVGSLVKGVSYDFILQSNTELPQNKYQYISLSTFTVDGIQALYTSFSLPFEITEAVTPTVTVNYNNNPYSNRYITLNEEYFGNGKPFNIQLEGLDENDCVEIYIRLKNPEWVNGSKWAYSLEGTKFSNDGNLRFTSEGEGVIQVGSQYIQKGSINLYLNVKLTDKVAETLEYEVSVRDVSSRVYSFTIIEKNLCWEFSPQKIDLEKGQELPFTITAKNVDSKLSGLPASISLNIEGSKRDEVEVDFVDDNNQRVPLNVMVHPDWPDANICVTESYVVPNLEEGRVYKFVFRYIGAFSPGVDENGDIQVESLFLGSSYNMSVPFDLNSRLEYQISQKTSAIIVTDEMFYEVGHKEKDVVVTSNGVYVIDEEDASIGNLTLEEGGQIKLKQSLHVQTLDVQRNIIDNQWTTFAAPERLILEDGTGALFNEETLVARYGYTSENRQMWASWKESDITEGSVILLATSKEEPMTICFHNPVTETLTLPALQNGTAASGNIENGNWFHFVGNPYWENLMINGRAYVLDAVKNSFELMLSPVIPPFQAYMVASEAMMSKVRSLRLGDLPTSVEDVQSIGFRTWTEGRMLCFETVDARNVEIYSLQGVCMGHYERSIGTQRINLPQGTYLVVCDGTAVKVVL